MEKFYNFSKEINEALQTVLALGNFSFKDIKCNNKREFIDVASLDNVYIRIEHTNYKNITISFVIEVVNTKDLCKFLNVQCIKMFEEDEKGNINKLLVLYKSNSIDKTSIELLNIIKTL